MQRLRAAIRRNPTLFSIGRWAQLTSPLSRIEPELRLLPFLVDPHRVAVDVGAHSGIYTYALSRLAHRVIAVEPNPLLAQDLAKAFVRAPVRVVAEAASDASETVLLRTPVDQPGGEGLATLSPSNTLAGSKVSTTSVTTRPLDQIVKEEGPIGFIKIDVEGHELAVLRGARHTLDDWRPTMLIEAEERHRPDAVASLTEYLRPWGYRGFVLRNQVLTSIAGFDPSRDQVSRDVAVPAHDHRGAYLNNFIFIAESISAELVQPSDTLESNRS
jgi:FkbM family methyltransferase